MKRILIATCMVLVAAAGAFAEELLTVGKYSMNDGKMSVTFEVKQISGGKYFIEGGGSNASGGMCMMNGVGEFQNGLFAFGYKCFLKLTNTNGKLEILDEKGCSACDSGAYVSGSYSKQ